MSGTTRRTTIRRALAFLLALAFLIIVFDYGSYHSRHRRAMAVVSDLHGRAGSLMGWPWGKELIISFSRSLTDGELARLSVLNSLAGRDYVAVAFDCDLTPQQLETARRVLSECRVYQPKASFRKRFGADSKSTEERR